MDKLKPRELRVLYIIQTHEKIFSQDVAQILGISDNNMSKPSKVLFDNAFIEKEKIRDGHALKNVYTITKLGAKQPIPKEIIARIEDKPIEKIEEKTKEKPKEKSKKKESITVKQARKAREKAIEKPLVGVSMILPEKPNADDILKDIREEKTDKQKTKEGLIKMFLRLQPRTMDVVPLGYKTGKIGIADFKTDFLIKLNSL